MPENRFFQLALYAVALAAIAFLGARWIGAGDRAGGSPPRAPAMSIEESSGGRATVHVAGAVRAPGVYRLRSGARVDDAVRRAGGPTSRADLTQVNLAAEVEDGRQVLVPELADETAGSPVAGGSASGGPASHRVPLNLNTATLEQLDTLDGIGPMMAQKIVDYRQANNGFGSVDELGEVPGIGEKRLAVLRELVRV